MSDLIGRYVEETVRHLSLKERAELAKELEANIQDMIGGDDSEQHVEQVLLDMGSPSVLAKQYRGKERYLIGPETFDFYWMVLKLVCLVVGIVTVVITLISLFFTESPVGIGTMIAKPIASLFSALSGAFLWVTITFAIMDYYQVNATLESWDAKALHDLEEAPTRLIKKSDSIADLVGLSVFFLLLAVLFNRPELIALYRKDAAPVPLFIGQALRPYVIGWMATVILSFIVSALKWFKGKWTSTLFVLSASVDLLGIIYFIFVATRWKLYNPAFLTIFPGSMTRWQIIIKAASVVLLILTLIGNGDDAYTVFRRTRPDEAGPARQR
ncbi:MAG: hypothetical protein GX315_07695 [Spirochaetales bacterium]|nr:hypothetical protein [Spirochaetales bacterium]